MNKDGVPIIAVTGASGFLGRYVLTELIRHPVEVVAVSRDPDRLPSGLPRLKVVKKDLHDPRASDYDVLGRPDVLLHLAWEGLPHYQSLIHFENEMPLQYRFLKNLITAGLPALLVTGTCLEYGAQSGPLREHLGGQPISAYGYAKDGLRRQIEFLHRTHAFSLTWARLFYLYGEGQAPGSLYSQLKAAVAQGDTHFGMSGGEQLRDYLPVAEVARILVALALKRDQIGVINVCSGTPRSVRTLAESWIQEHQWKIELDFGRYPYPEYEPMAFWGDRSYLDSVLGPA